MNRSISVLSSLKENRNDNTSRSKSPQRIINGIRLFNFSDMESYKHINKPYLNDLKKQHIKNKLDLEQITLKRLSSRLRKNQLFVPYDHNPFAANQTHSKSQNHIIVEYERNAQGQNLIDQINELKKKKKVNKQKEGKKIGQIKRKASKISGLVQRQLKNTKSENIAFDQPRKNQSMIVLREKVANKSQFADEQPIFSSQMDFDEIIALEQRRFVGNTVKQMNIFSIIFQSAQKVLNKTVQTLLKYFFSFNSIFQKFQRFKIQIYRDISLQSRKTSAQKIKGRSLQNQDAFIRSELTFKDLVNVASGRYTPEHVYDQMNMDKNEKGTDSEYDENQIVYKKGQHNISSMYHKDNQELKEIEDYLRLTLSKKEQNYKKLNLKRVNDIDNKLSQIEKLVNLTIEDRKLHKQLREMINNELINYTNQNYRYPDNAIEKNRLVSDRKEKKTKDQFIKLEGLTKANQLCKQHDRKVEQLIKKRV